MFCKVQINIKKISHFTDKNSSEFYIKIQFMPNREHGPGPLQRLTGKLCL